MTNTLPARNKEALFRKIRQCKKRYFPGTGSGQRLAAAVGVAPQIVSNWLNGSRTPTFEQLHRLAKVFGVSPLELCGVRKRVRAHRDAADIFLLRSLLEVLEYATRHDGSLPAIVKTMKSFNALFTKEMENIESEGNKESTRQLTNIHIF